MCEVNSLLQSIVQKRAESPYPPEFRLSPTRKCRNRPVFPPVKIPRRQAAGVYTITVVHVVNGDYVYDAAAGPTATFTVQ